MAYPDELLSEGEEVRVHSHPHGKMLIGPVIVLAVVLGGGGWLAVLADGLDQPWRKVALIAIGGLALVLVLWGVLPACVRWRTTHFIVTTERLIVRAGVIKRTGIDIPMARISSVQFRHSVVVRMFCYGTLSNECASDEPVTCDDIPRVELVHNESYQQVGHEPSDDDYRTERE